MFNWLGRQIFWGKNFNYFQWVTFTENILTHEFHFAIGLVLSGVPHSCSCSGTWLLKLCIKCLVGTWLSVVKHTKENRRHDTCCCGTWHLFLPARGRGKREAAPKCQSPWACWQTHRGWAFLPSVTCSFQFFKLTRDQGAKLGQEPHY